LRCLQYANLAAVDVRLAKLDSWTQGPYTARGGLARCGSAWEWWAIIYFESSLRLRHLRKARAFCLSVRGFVRYAIRETLTLDTLEDLRRTFSVADLAGVPLEIPFREVARQMGFAD
jgi:hypothetical protein